MTRYVSWNWLKKDIFQSIFLHQIMIDSTISYFTIDSQQLIFSTKCLTQVVIFQPRKNLVWELKNFSFNQSLLKKWNYWLNSRLISLFSLPYFFLLIKTCFRQFIHIENWFFPKRQTYWNHKDLNAYLLIKTSMLKIIKFWGLNHLCKNIS